MKLHNFIIILSGLLFSSITFSQTIQTSSRFVSGPAYNGLTTIFTYTVDTKGIDVNSLHISGGVGQLATISGIPDGWGFTSGIDGMGGGKYDWVVKDSTIAKVSGILIFSFEVPGAMKAGLGEAKYDLKDGSLHSFDLPVVPYDGGNIFVG
ncbi:hypothetical protein [Methylomonas sp. CM2]|uniref:hypothetical protein n=1 Tax=Methylomonas sp. CM2 TaxID=3417647 RepID=UPI003CF3772D